MFVQTNRKLPREKYKRKKQKYLGKFFTSLFSNITDSSMGCNINAQKNFENEYVLAVNT